MTKKQLQSFLVFEGGGAKGLAHLGVMESIEQASEIDVVGYAGTSAGSIPATLAAAGISSKEIFDTVSNRSPIMCDTFAQDGYHPASIFGRGRLTLDYANRIFSSRAIVIVILAFFALVALSVFYFLEQLISRFIVDPTTHGFWFSLFLVFSFCLSIYFPCYWWILKFRGFVSLEDFIENFNKVLVHQIDPENSETRGEHINFSDLYNHNQEDISLRIVATDITNGTTKVFSTLDTKRCSVARAVAASIAIPIIFKPVKIGETEYCDGGLVSNLPAWTFEHEQSLGPKFTTITSEVGLGIKPKAKLLGLNLFFRLILIGVFGSQSLSMRGIQNHIQIRPDVGLLKLLNFEMSADTAKKTIDSGRKAAKAAFKIEMAEKDTLDTFHTSVRKSIEDCAQAREFKAPSALRSFYVKPVIQPFQSTVALHYANTIGFDSDVDQIAVIPLTRGSIFLEADQKTKPVFRAIGDVSNLDNIFGQRNDDMWLETIMRKDRKMVTCCSLLQENGDKHFIGFDADTNIPEEDAKQIVSSAILFLTNKRISQ